MLLFKSWISHAYCHSLTSSVTTPPYGPNLVPFGKSLSAHTPSPAPGIEDGLMDKPGGSVAWGLVSSVVFVCRIYLYTNDAQHSS